jgi:hypothetical protein
MTKSANTQVHFSEYPTRVSQKMRNTFSLVAIALMAAARIPRGAYSAVI